MKINNNIQALNAYRNLNQNQIQTSKNLEKLSSGLRINRASDDAAGLAISEKMRSQIRGLKMAERNAMDGISLMQTAEGALTEVHAMLQRMRELAVQGANDTNTDYDREQIQKEIDQLKKEINSVSEKTEFNTRKLLDGSSAVLTVFEASQNNINVQGFPKVLDAELGSGVYQVNIKETEIKSQIIQSGSGIGAVEDVKFADPENSELKLGQYSILVRDVMTDGGTGGTAKIEILDPDGLSLGVKSVNIGTDAAGPGEEGRQVAGLEIDTSKIRTSGTAKVSLEAETKVTLSKEGPDGFEEISAERTLTSTRGRIVHAGIEYNFASNIPTNGSLTFQTTNNALSFQIGANTNQSVMIDIPQMDIVELGVESVNVTTQTRANDAIFQLDRAINIVSDARAKLGAIQNRLEHTINNLQVTHENLTASESRIRDADMALEMTIFTRNNILNQSATAMLAQANQLPQGVLQLLQ
ncbi:flagellin [Bacillus alkalicellulosilyticus]|uniref:flagellin N-terminal helical domain-containing protein n=1 Tax=Alkalihalobacterium alkalicellulosilyticum TaxID=1912214 RepID=UPI000995EFE8|nr:flagellin [Bacillus alkalicellulosilyticus]